MTFCIKILERYMTIEKITKVYLDGIEYYRVFLKESNYFHDVRVQMYAAWKENLGHTELDELEVS